MDASLEYLKPFIATKMRFVDASRPPMWATSVATIVGFCRIACLLYERALPKLIPGIPCDPQAARHIMGNIPGMMRLKADQGATFVDCLVEQSQKLDTPLF